MLSFCYQQYLKAMEAFDQLFFCVERRFKRDFVQSPEVVEQWINGLTFEEADALATRLGNRYRGIGVSVGILGILIILFAIAPTALEITGLLELVLGIAKVLSMAVMVGLVVYGSRSGLRRRWITARRHAESLRYQSLFCQIQCLKDLLAQEERNKSMISEAARLKDQVTNLLGAGTKHCQISYNKRKGHQYEAVERIGDRLGWIGFFLAFSAALSHLFWHASWLLLLTVFVPALIGAIHGINGFLKLGDLAEDHLTMSARLSQVAEELERTPAGDAIRLTELSELVYQLLTNRDVQWTDTANRLGLKVA